MIVYPAIDIRGGRVVRLQQGDPSRETVFSDDPVAVARRWERAGARWLHVINLDGTLDATAPNLAALRAIAALGIPVQYGGGLRAPNDVSAALNAGAARVILGTLAVAHPETVGELVQQYGSEVIVVALDARDGRVATHGWQRASEWSAVDLGKRFAALGVRHALYTDISRDGALEGVNIKATAALARQTGLSVIASGGVASLADIQSLHAAESGITGVVIGRALYTGALDLAQAIRAASQEN